MNDHLLRATNYNNMLKRFVKLETRPELYWTHGLYC